MKRVIAIATVVVSALLGLADEGWACTCISSGPPCQAAFAADVIFAGSVRSITSIDSTAASPGQFPLFRRRVTFDDVEGFRGTTERTLDVLTGGGGGDCGFGFVVGERYLVYALKGLSGVLTTSICSRTATLARAGEDVAFLRSLPEKGSGARVFGLIMEVQREPAAYGAVEKRPLVGIRITVQSGAFERDVLSDGTGRYEVTGVPAGKAKILVNAPFGYDPRHLTHDIDITDLRACSAVDFYLSLRAAVSGTVVDAAGRAVAGVNIDVLPAELAGTDPERRRFVTTDTNGVFNFDDLPPGRYGFRSQRHETSARHASWRQCLSTRRAKRERRQGH